jgi:hypothetical protein
MTRTGAAEDHGCAVGDEPDCLFRRDEFHVSVPVIA